METKELENKILNTLTAVKDNAENIIYLVDYPNSSEEDEDGRANVVCVHYEDTYMVDNVVGSKNTRRIYLDDIIANPSKYTLYTLTPFTVDKLK